VKLNIEVPKELFMSHTFSVCHSCKSLNKVSTEKALKSEAVCGKCGKNLEMHGLVTEVGTKDFDRILKASDLPVIVDFWASWCGPCQDYGPQFEEASKKNTQAVFLKVSTETEPDLTHRFNIRGIPLTIIFKNGKEVKRQPGAISAEMISSLL
jgi:thioredoxin 2